MTVILTGLQSCPSWFKLCKNLDDPKRWLCGSDESVMNSEPPGASLQGIGLCFRCLQCYLTSTKCVVCWCYEIWLS